MTVIDVGFEISNVVLRAFVDCETRIPEFAQKIRLSEYELRLRKKPGFKMGILSPSLDAPTAFACAYQGSFDGKSQNTDSTNMYVWSLGVVPSARGSNHMAILLDAVHSLKDTVPKITTVSFKTSPQFPAMMHLAPKLGYAVHDHYGAGLEERYIFVKTL